MHAFVYKSLRQADTYVYLAKRDDFAQLPPPLATQLGNAAVRPRSRVDARAQARAAPIAEVVRGNLAARGFHVQFPPTMLDPMTEDWGTDA